LAEEYIQARAEKVNPDKARQILAGVSERELLEGDEL
jgi:hypothetical protein